MNTAATSPINHLSLTIKNMNYEAVYQTLKTKLQALACNAAIRLPNEPPADETDLDIDVSVTETDSNIRTEIDTRRNVSIDLLLSIPVSTGTERIHNIAAKIVAAFDPLHKGNFWAGKPRAGRHFVRIDSAGQRQPSITKTRYQINVRILATIDT